jgi:hypothetical protein
MGEGTVNSGKIFDATVSSGTVYSSEFKNQKRGGFRISTKANQGAETLDATLFLQSWDPDNGWITEPLATFNAHITTGAFASVDTFIDTQAEKYRTGVTHNSGTGPVVQEVSMQTEE